MHKNYKLKNAIKMKVIAPTSLIHLHTKANGKIKMTYKLIQN